MSAKPGFLKRLMYAVQNFFFPPAGASRWRRVLPYLLLGVLTLVLLTAGAYGWEYTNSAPFCGESCHTMPPEYAAYQVSPHARVECVECHIGKGFIATRITRKASDIRHVTATLFTTYEFPIRAGRLRPARETCELCHYPAKFSDDSLREIVQFGDDETNTRQSIFLAMRTGGGTEREGLGRGIHWHIESEVWFVATDPLQQNIPYVRVVAPDGREDVFIALDSPYTREELESMPQVEMDCITCHNRITHMILPPERAVDVALNRRQLDQDLPFIRFKAVSVLSEDYATDEEAHAAIEGLADYYREEFPQVYAERRASVEQAVAMVRAIYDDSVFRAQEVNWATHPNNIGHLEWPGCFRCHGGQHVNAEGQAIRLECNLCHSIPQVVAANTIEPVLPLGTGIQPESHFSTHWIALHRTVFDQTCQACHTVGNPGGTDNSTFCSNSACHGTAWEYAGLDAPGLTRILAAEQPPPPAEVTPPPEEEAEEQAAEEEVEEAVEEEAEALTYDGLIGQLFETRCGACHIAAIMAGDLALDSYDAAMIGGADGPVIVPGAPDDSLLIQIQRDVHFGLFEPDELELVIQWIADGAPER